MLDKSQLTKPLKPQKPQLEFNAYDLISPQAGIEKSDFWKQPDSQFLKQSNSETNDFLKKM